MADDMSQAATPQRGNNGEVETSISVVCRVRPLNNRELRDGEDTSVMVSPNGTSVNVQTLQDVVQFNYDAVVGQEGTQADMYALAADPIVQDFLQGYNGTVFAYGQTGSGKTYTMEGILGDREKQGLVPRMIGTIFNYIDDCPDHVTCSLEIQFLEIYNEKIRDLLSSDKDNLRVRGSQAGNIFVDGATSAHVSSELEVLELMEMGASARATAETVMNESSSRSHSMFIITLEQTNHDDGSWRKSKLFMVDLAGSEILRKTGAEGTTLKEAQHINRSLSALNKVISALSEGKKSHIPYRDSKLTRILEEAIGGNCRTALIICCSPSSSQETETVSTMRFGKSAKRIKNKARINREQSPAELKMLLADMRKRVKEMEGVVAAKNYEIGLLTGGGQGGDEMVLRMVEIKEEILRERETRAKTEEENQRLQARIRELETEHEDQMDDMRSEVERLQMALALKEQEQRREQADYAENLARAGSLPSSFPSQPRAAPGQSPAQRGRQPEPMPAPARGRRGEVGGGGMPIGGGVAGGVAVAGARRGAASHMWDGGEAQQQEAAASKRMTYAEELRAQMEAEKARKASEKAAEREAARREEQQRAAALEEERATAHLRRDKFGNILPPQLQPQLQQPPAPAAAPAAPPPGRRRAAYVDEDDSPLGGGGGFAAGFGQDGAGQQSNRLGKPQVAAFADYQEELRQQMEEKKRAKQLEKEKELEWERKQEERVRQAQAEMAAEKAKEKPIKGGKGGGGDDGGVMVVEGPKPKGGAKWEARNAGPPKPGNLDDYHEELRKQMEEKKLAKQRLQEEEAERERKDAERLKRQQEELRAEDERDRKLQAEHDAKKAAKKGGGGGGMGGVLILEGPKPGAAKPAPPPVKEDPPPKPASPPKQERANLGEFVEDSAASKPKSPPQHGRRAKSGGEEDPKEEMLETLKEDMKKQQQRLEELMAKQQNQISSLQPTAKSPAPAARPSQPEEDDTPAFPVIYPLDPRDLKYLCKSPEAGDQARSKGSGRDRRTAAADVDDFDDFDDSMLRRRGQRKGADSPRQHAAPSRRHESRHHHHQQQRHHEMRDSMDSFGGPAPHQLGASSAYMDKLRRDSTLSSFSEGIFAH